MRSRSSFAASITGLLAASLLFPACGPAGSTEALRSHVTGPARLAQMGDPWRTEVEQVHGGRERANALPPEFHRWLGTDPGMAGPIVMDRLSAASDEEAGLRLLFTWTAALDWGRWMSEMGWQPENEDGRMELAQRFALNWEGPPADLPSSLVQTAGEGNVRFLRRSNADLQQVKNPPRRVTWWLEERVDEGWRWINPVRERIQRDGAPDGLEWVEWSTESPNALRVVGRVEPPPLLFAHYMPALWPGSGALAWHMGSQQAREELTPDGRSMDHPDAGGHYRDFPLIRPDVTFENSPRATELSAELDIRRAMRAGFDGFAIDMWGGGPPESLEPLFRAARKIHSENPGTAPFLISVVPDWANLSTPAGDKIRFWDCDRPAAENQRLISASIEAAADGIATWLSYLERDGGAFAAHVAHRGGWPLVMGYNSYEWIDVYLGLEKRAVRDCHANNCDESPGGNCVIEWKLGRREYSPQEIGLLAWRAFDSIRGEVEKRLGASGLEIAWQFDLGNFYYPRDGENHHRYGELAQELGRYFPAVTRFLPYATVPDAREAVALSGAEWGEPLNAQYRWGARKSPIDAFLRGWYSAIGQDFERGNPWRPWERSSLIQATTWNDYGEWSHFAPGLNTRYALVELNRYFASLWKTGAPPAYRSDPVYAGEDAVLVLLHRKYSSFDEEGEPVRFSPFEGHRPALDGQGRLIAGNAISVLAILFDPVSPDEEVTLSAPERIGPVAFPPGAQFLRLEVIEEGNGTNPALAPGPVQARLTRGGRIVAEVESPEWIAEAPFRADLSLVGITNVFESNWRRDWENPSWPARVRREADRPFLYSEYRHDSLERAGWERRLRSRRGWFDF